MNVSTVELRNAVGEFLTAVKEWHTHGEDDLLRELAKYDTGSFFSAVDEFVQKLFEIQEVEGTAFLFMRNGALTCIFYMAYQREVHAQAMKRFSEFRQNLPSLLQPSAAFGTLTSLFEASIAERLKTSQEQPFLLEDADALKSFNPELETMPDEEVVRLWNEEMPPPQIAHIAIFKRSGNNSIETSVHSY